MEMTHCPNCILPLLVAHKDPGTADTWRKVCLSCDWRSEPFTMANEPSVWEPTCHPV